MSSELFLASCLHRVEWTAHITPALSVCPCSYCTEHGFPEQQMLQPQRRPSSTGGPSVETSEVCVSGTFCICSGTALHVQPNDVYSWVHSNIIVLCLDWSSSPFVHTMLCKCSTLYPPLQACPARLLPPILLQVRATGRTWRVSHSMPAFPCLLFVRLSKICHLQSYMQLQTQL